VYIEDIEQKFSELKSIIDIFKNSFLDDNLYSHHNKIIIYTHFKKYLTLIDNRLYQTSDFNIASFLEITLTEHKIYFRIPSSNLFIFRISKNGQVLLSHTPSFFEYIRYNNETIAIKVEDKFLSARANSSIGIVDKPDLWEKLKIIDLH
ncbi:MAG: hypothetical protein HDQ93_00950, partial [Desulfovibrio sp.]|nr:hypothetical protein [Desulfovibrio sp.]